MAEKAETYGQPLVTADQEPSSAFRVMISIDCCPFTRSPLRLMRSATVEKQAIPGGPQPRYVIV